MGRWRGLSRFYVYMLPLSIRSTMQSQGMASDTIVFFCFCDEICGCPATDQRWAATGGIAGGAGNSHPKGACAVPPVGVLLSFEKSQSMPFA
jgi:hypothetical protein